MARSTAQKHSERKHCSQQNAEILMRKNRIPGHPVFVGNGLLRVKKRLRLTGSPLR
jgi:hypothetical protein